MLTSRNRVNSFYIQGVFGFSVDCSNIIDMYVPNKQKGTLVSLLNWVSTLVYSNESNSQHTLRICLQ